VFGILAIVSTGGVVELVASLQAFFVEGADAAALHDTGNAIAKVRGFLDALTARCARRSAELHTAGASPDATDALRRSQRLSARAAAAAARRAAALGDMPLLSDAIEHGDTSVAAADVVTRALRAVPRHLRDAFLAAVDERVVGVDADDVELVVRAVIDELTAPSPDEIAARQRRAMRLTKWVDHVSGMHHVRMELDPETGVRVFAAIDGHLRSVLAKRREDRVDDDVTRDQLAAVAVAEVVCDGSPAARARSVDVSVIYRPGTGAGWFGDGSPIAPGSLRPLLCDATFVPVAVDGSGRVLNVGRSSRLETPAIRRALKAMYPTCAHSGCRVAFDDCHIHHLDEWDHGGSTDIGRLAPVCSRHHHLIHDGGWHIDIDPARTITVTRPDGHIEHHVPYRAPPWSAAA
jgi:hypothetical protein